MAQSRHVSSLPNIQNIIEQVQSLQISNEIREELRDCLQRIADIDLNSLCGRSGDSKCTKVIILLNKFAKAIVDVLGALNLLPSILGTIFNVITEVVGFIFKKDVASVVIKRITAILEADLIQRCIATCTKITRCISYIQGLPEASKLTQIQKNVHLQLAAADCPVTIGLDEVLCLGEKIKDKVKIADMKRTDNLFEHVQCYCCLTTFWDLFALYRFAIQSGFSVDARSISNILETQKTYDKEVLEFLYRPSTRTVRLFRSYNANQWPILADFLDRRGLHTENLSELSGRTVVIKSVSNIGKVLTPCIDIVLLCKEDVLSLTTGAQNVDSFLELRGGLGNVFTIWSLDYYPPRQVYCDKSRMRIGEDEPPPSYSRFYILKLQPETPQETPCYMIWLENDSRKCIRAYYTDCVWFSSNSKPGKRFFWQLEDVP